MKKKLVLGAAIALLLCSATVIVKELSVSEKTDRQYLYEAGFKNIPDFKNWEKNEQRKYWRNELDLGYITYEEAERLMTVNEFIVAESDKYIGSIPDTVMTTIRTNYEKFKPYLLNYSFNQKYIVNASTYLMSSKEVGWLIRGRETFDNWDVPLFFSNDLHDRVNPIHAPNLGMPNISHWEMNRFYENDKIYVIGHHSKFVEGTTSDSTKLVHPLPINKDPIAVVKHRGGYVILAKWE